jgi:hypothetical protein
MKPILTRDELTGRIYVLTSYVYGRDQLIEARTKYDVTEQYEALRAADNETGR